MSQVQHKTPITRVAELERKVRELEHTVQLLVSVQFRPVPKPGTAAEPHLRLVK